MAHFILMLTRDDCTVPDAQEVYESIRAAPLGYVGFKDIGLPPEQLRELARRIHEDEHEVLLEVVSTDREAELRSIEVAMSIGVDYVLGGRNVSEAVKILEGTNIRYFPFCGETVGHPTRLTGTIESIVLDAQRIAAIPGVHGLDLLSYRFDGDAALLTQCVVESVKLPVIAAGSIDSAERVRSMCDAGVWGFTIGSALFEGRFVHDQLAQQIRSVVQMRGVSP